MLLPTYILMFAFLQPMVSTESGQMVCGTNTNMCYAGLCLIDECLACGPEAVCETSNPDEVVPRELQRKTTVLVLTYIGPEVELTAAMFANLPYLKHITIQGRISGVASDTFIKQKHITQLTIRKSKVKRLPNRLFWPNNTLEKLNIPLNSLTEIPANLFPNIPNIKQLDLSFNPFEDCEKENETITPEFKKLLKLTTLSLAGYGGSQRSCQNISKEYLRPIQHVQFLDLNDSLLFHGNEKILMPLVQLQSLSISGVAPYKNCPALAKNLFANLPSQLVSIHLQNWTSFDPFNESCLLDENALKGLKQLKKLSLFDARYSNKIFGNAVKASMFSGFPSIRKIFLDWCGIAAVESGAFNAIPYVLNVQLNGNLLGPRKLQLYTGNNTSELEVLELNNVGINVANYGASNLLAVFPSLKQLYMDNNFLWTVPEFGFSKNISSTVVAFTLNGNSIEKLSIEDGKKLCGVMKLLAYFKAEGNTITDISGISFCLKLKKLFLRSNLLGTNASSNFQALATLENLVRLDLSYNKIRYLPTELFTNLKQLSTLNVANNELFDLSDELFMSIANLKTLDLSANDLISFNKSMVSNGLRNIVNLYLQANQIAVLSPELLNEFSTQCTSLEMLGLEGNPLVCSCDDYLPKWVKNSSVIMQVKYLKCSTPGDEDLTTQVISYQPNYFQCKVKLPLVITAEVLAAVVVTILLAVPCYKYRWYIRHPRIVFRAIGEKLKQVKFDQKCEYDAFISYDASNDSDSRWVADKLIPTVEMQNSRGVPLKSDIKLYVVDRDSAIGSSKYTERCRAIESSRKIIFVLSNSYLTNPTCISEADLVAGYELMDGQHCYHPNRILVLTLEELNEEAIKAPVTSLLIENVINIADNEARMKRIWRKVKRFLSKPEYVYRKRKRVARKKTPLTYTAPSEIDPLLQ